MLAITFAEFWLLSILASWNTRLDNIFSINNVTMSKCLVEVGKRIPCPTITLEVAALADCDAFGLHSG